MNIRNIIFTTILLELGCLISRVSQARQQSEDRGNGNSAAEGVQALNLATTGSDNTAHGGFRSLATRWAHPVVRTDVELKNAAAGRVAKK